MHPAAVVGIIVGGILCIWGGYEAGSKVLDWISVRRERRKYEEFCREYRKQQSYEVPPAYDEKECQKDEDASSSCFLRQRKNISNNMNEKSEDTDWDYFDEKHEQRQSYTPQQEKLMQDEQEWKDRIERRGNSLLGLPGSNKEKENEASEDDHLFVERVTTASPVYELPSMLQASSAISSSNDEIPTVMESSTPQSSPSLSCSSNESWTAIEAVDNSYHESISPSSSNNHDDNSLDVRSLPTSDEEDLRSRL